MKRLYALCLVRELVEQCFERCGSHFRVCNPLGRELIESSTGLDGNIPESVRLTRAESLERCLVGCAEAGEELRGKEGLMEEGLGGGVDVGSRRVDRGCSYTRILSAWTSREAVSTHLTGDTERPILSTARNSSPGAVARTCHFQMVPLHTLTSAHGHMRIKVPSTHPASVVNLDSGALCCCRGAPQSRASTFVRPSRVPT